MTIELTEQEACDFSNAVRVAIVYVFDRLRQGVGQSHPDRHDGNWYKLFGEDVKRATCLRSLLEKLDPSERKESET